MEDAHGDEINNTDMFDENKRKGINKIKMARRKMYKRKGQKDKKRGRQHREG
jgi:hypothetical protein